MNPKENGLLHEEHPSITAPHTPVTDLPPAPTPEPVEHIQPTTDTVISGQPSDSWIDALMRKYGLEDVEDVI